VNVRLGSLGLIGAVAALAALSACGGSGQSSGSYGSSPATTQATTTAPTPTTTGPGALQAEAASAATGDIPDNQVFLSFRNRPAGYSIKYPEGWVQSGAGRRVTFRDKNNIVRIVVENGSLPTAGQVRKQVSRLPGLKLRSGPDAVTIAGAPAYKVVYSTDSAPNPVTGKRVTLVVDRYELSHAGKLAIVDLGTPEGVDNVDAYRLMSESFRWK
jgi:hypothetical protein